MTDERKKPVQQAEKKEIEHEERNLLETAHDIIDQAKQGLAETNEPEIMLGDGKEENVADKFKGLPMRELIAAPLLAAAEAQERLAGVAWDFYQKIAYDTDGDKKTDPKTNKKTRLLEFTVERPVERGGVIKTINHQIKAPFIGLVPIPSLLIDRIDVDFQMEVTATNTETDTTNKEVSTDISGGWWAVKATVSGKVTSSRENTRSTNQTAKYQVHVSASQQPQTEGLSKLMDIMASCVEPIQVQDGK